MKLILESNNLDDYLIETSLLDYHHSSITTIIKKLELEKFSDIERIKVVYEFVRDKISHSWDIQSNVVTKKASEVAEKGAGICYAKSNLLAALLRKMKVPCGFCYQRLMLFDKPEKGYCIHAFNAVYIQSMDKWFLLDARGNKPGVQAEFSLTNEKLAFCTNEELGEKTYPYIFVSPNKKTMDVLESAEDAIEMYKYHLPDKL